MNVWIFNAHAEPPMGQATRHFDLAKGLVGQGHNVTIITGSFSHHSLQQMVDTASWDAKSVVTEHGRTPQAQMAWKEGVCFILIPLKSYDNGKLSRLQSWRQYYTGALAWSRGPIAHAVLHHPDVIVGVTAHIGAALVAMKIAKDYRVPFIYEVTDIWPRMPIESGAIARWNPLVPWLRYQDQRLAYSAKAIVGYWPRMDRHYNTIAPNTPCHFIPHPVALERYSEWAVSPTNNAFQVMYVGSLSAFYDVNEIVNVARRLAGVQIPANGYKKVVEFTIVGNGADRERLVSRVINEGIPRVRFIGAIPKIAVPAMLAQADATVFTMKPLALHREFGLSGNKISDYCAAGKPLLLNTQAILYPDDLIDGGGAIRTSGSNLGSTILWLMAQSPERLARMGQQSRKVAEDYYDVRIVARHYLTLLEEARHC